MKSKDRSVPMVSVNLRVLPDQYDYYRRVLKPRGVTWRAIIAKGISEVDGNKEASVVAKFQRKLTELSLQKDIDQAKLYLYKVRIDHNEGVIGDTEYFSIKSVAAERLKQAEIAYNRFKYDAEFNQDGEAGA